MQSLQRPSRTIKNSKKLQSSPLILLIFCSYHTYTTYIFLFCRTFMLYFCLVCRTILVYNCFKRGDKMNRDTLKQIMVDQKDIYLNNPIISRHYPLEDNVNYCFVGIRRTGKSYMMYQQIS